MAVNGVPIGGAFLTHSILADVIDYDEFLHGARCEASFCVFATVIPKFLAIPASALPLAAVNLLGFVPPVGGVSQPQSARVRGFIGASFVALPVASAAVALALKTRFPIRTPAIAADVQAGIAAHAAGEGADDPVTGRRVRLMDAGSDRARADVWRYECFSARLLDILLETGSSRALVRSTAAHVGAAAASLACCLAATGATARLVGDARLSVFPVLGAIFSGASLSYLCVSAARLAAARSLGRGDASRHGALIRRVRSGRGSTMVEVDEVAPPPPPRGLARRLWRGARAGPSPLARAHATLELGSAASPRGGGRK